MCNPVRTMRCWRWCAFLLWTHQPEVPLEQDLEGGLHLGADADRRGEDDGMCACLPADPRLCPLHRTAAAPGIDWLEDLDVAADSSFTATACLRMALLHL